MVAATWRNVAADARMTHSWVREVHGSCEAMIPREKNARASSTVASEVVRGTKGVRSCVPGHN